MTSIAAMICRRYRHTSIATTLSMSLLLEVNRERLKKIAIAMTYVVATGKTLVTTCDYHRYRIYEQTRHST
ncbi:hypothetical protein TorRG33x02_273110, partial [Trema orientale]